MSDPHTLEGQVQRAKRLRQQIEELKSGERPGPVSRPESLREQVEERAQEARVAREQDTGKA